MKTTINFILLATLVLTIPACSGHMRSLTKDEIKDTVQSVEREPSYLKLEQAQQTVALALEYHDQGAFEKSAELFTEAANLFRDVNSKLEERRALIAAAKVQLKCSHREPFLLTMARYRILIDRLEMPPEDERFLCNLADHMKGKPLTYPVNGSWQIVFKD